MNTGRTRGSWDVMFRFKRHLIFLALLSFPFSAIAAADANPNDTSEKAANPSPSESETKGKKIDKIEVGDHLIIKIYPEDSYIKGGEMEVSSEGTITLPLVGKVKVEGMQIVDAERELVRILAQDYLVDPVVVIEIKGLGGEKAKKSVSILGQVQKPGSYDIPPREKLTLLRLISMAGGFTDVANVKKIKVIRKENTKTQVIHANAEAIISGKKPDIELTEEDVVHVGESFF